MHSLDWTQRFFSFWLLDHPNLVWVLLGACLLGASAAVVGAFMYFKKRALIGDALAHAALPGVMMAFLLFESRDPWIMLLGALCSSVLGYVLIEYLTQRTKIKPDSALAMVLSFFFALGIFLLSLIQTLPLEGKSGLDKLLFGQSAAMTLGDVQTLALLAVLILMLVLLLFYRLRMVIFDAQYAAGVGLSVRVYEALMGFCIVVVVVVGLQIVGVILMTAVLLIPVAAAHFWTHHFSRILALGAAIGVMAGALSTNISYTAPGMPSGPWMVLVLVFIFVLSWLLGTRKGWVGRTARAESADLTQGTAREP
jgi:manganese/zinc/iron transport system permease protein